jgi:hypothetical protein
MIEVIQLHYEVAFEDNCDPEMSSVCVQPTNYYKLSHGITFSSL